MRGSILPPHRIRPILRPEKALGLRQHGGKARGARPFRHGLLQGEEDVDGALEQRLFDQNNFGDKFLHDGQRQFADLASPRCLRPRWLRRMVWRHAIAFHIDG